VYRTLLILLAVTVVLTAVVRLLRTNWRSVGKRAGDVVKERADDVSAQADLWRDKATGVVRAVGTPAGRPDGQLERTFVVPAPATQVAPIVAAAMRRAPLFDAVDAQPTAGPGAPDGGGEAAAYVYEALGTVRLVVTADPRDPGRALVGVASYEVVMGDPQGGPATGHALDEIHAELTGHGLAVQQVHRLFTDAGGIRWAAPLD
jgi:hypothetical protein